MFLALGFLESPRYHTILPVKNQNLHFCKELPERSFLFTKVVISSIGFLLGRHIRFNKRGDDLRNAGSVQLPYLDPVPFSRFFEQHFQR